MAIASKSENSYYSFDLYTGSASYLALYLKLYTFFKKAESLGIDLSKHKEIAQPERFLKKAAKQIQVLNEAIEYKIQKSMKMESMRKI